MRRIRLALALPLALVACNKAPPSPQSEPPKPSAVAVDSASAASTPSSSAPAALASAPTIATAKPEKAGPPKDANVILISIDSLRADMPWAGYSRPIAPRLTELEKKAVSYTHAYAVSSYTSMSLGGLLGGRLPSGMKRSGYFFGSYPPAETLMFPELLQNAKVHTMGAQAHFYFQGGDKGAGLDQGFTRWEVVAGIKQDNTTDTSITSPQSEELAEKLLSEKPCDDKPFFFWAHFLDPHDIYKPHPGIGPYGNSDRDKYDAEVEFTDQYVGKLIDFIQKKPWADRTVILVTSDHGEAFGEHKMQRHGFEVWENLVRVPLFVIAPGATPRRIDEPRSGLDIAPTILELFNVAPDATFEGKSLVGEVYGKTAEPRDVVVDLPMTSDNDRRRALIHGKKKILCFHDDAQCKVYDLEADPVEEKPITTGEVFKEMHALYMAHAKTVKDIPPTRCLAGCLNGGYNKK